MTTFSKLNFNFYLLIWPFVWFLFLESTSSNSDPLVLLPLTLTPSLLRKTIPAYNFVSPNILWVQSPIYFVDWLIAWLGLSSYNTIYPSFLSTMEWQLCARNCYSPEYRKEKKTKNPRKLAIPACHHLHPGYCYMASYLTLAVSLELCPSVFSSAK